MPYSIARFGIWWQGTSPMLWSLICWALVIGMLVVIIHVRACVFTHVHVSHRHQCRGIYNVRYLGHPTFTLSYIPNSIHLTPPGPYSLVPSVYSITYSSLPYSTSFNLNFAPAEIPSSTFLVKITVFENDVVTSPVLFLAIIMTEITSEIREMPKAVYKTSWGKGEKVKPYHKSKEGLLTPYGTQSANGLYS